MPEQGLSLCAGLGALQAAQYDREECAGSIAAHPCKERKDGAPSVGMVDTNITTVATRRAGWGWCGFSRVGASGDASIRRSLYSMQ